MIASEPAAAAFVNTGEIVQDSASIVLWGGLVIGLAYGSVGLLSGFCLLSSLRGWWADGDSRLVRTFALALGVATAGTQLLRPRGTGA